jgi:hypothetical protein
LELQPDAFDGEQPMLKVPGGTSSISICVALSRTRQGWPVAAIASRSEALFTTPGSGSHSSTVYQPCVTV